ncbi:MAG: addiction module antidote protein [Burkholderiaceae bacterium]|jgi:probable addiction module antidote protein|nr:addiction module antidote protein [Burkholderiaceae bacterium]
MNDRPNDEAMAEVFRNDQAYAVELLNSILEDGDQGELLIALRQMSKAFGGMGKIAEQTQNSRPHLYTVLSERGNPELRNFTAILAAMGLRLTVQPIGKSAPRRRPSARGRTSAVA